MGNLVLSSFKTNIQTPLLFQNFFADGNNYSDLGIPENKFSGRAHAEYKYSVPTEFASPAPSKSNGRSLTGALDIFVPSLNARRWGTS